jgi:hypothetical protein
MLPVLLLAFYLHNRAQPNLKHLEKMKYINALLELKRTWAPCRSQVLVQSASIEVVIFIYPYLLHLL